jgi:hypothetical protein
MPANLNALIRYKEIDRCLSNPHRKCTIDTFIERCSEALGEYRGVYKRISERTIREDLRIMRSEILGFNAPIVFKDGYYYYDPSDYTIFKTSLKDFKVLETVLKMLIEERKNIKDPEVDIVILKLSHIIGIELPREVFADIINIKYDRAVEEDTDEIREQVDKFKFKSEGFVPLKGVKSYKGIGKIEEKDNDEIAFYSIMESRVSVDAFSWADILRLL